VLNTLLKPEDYVTVGIGHISVCQSKHKDPTVRIGITEQENIPFHKVVYDDPSGMVGVVAVHGHPIEFGAEVGFHLAHQVAVNLRGSDKRSF
jgi:hypothetical protein